MGLDWVEHQIGGPRDIRQEGEDRPHPMNCEETNGKIVGEGREILPSHQHSRQQERDHEVEQHKEHKRRQRTSLD